MAMVSYLFFVQTQVYKNGYSAAENYECRVVNIEYLCPSNSSSVNAIS